MKLADLADKKVAILGYGKEGQAALNAIHRKGVRCDVTIFDAKPDLLVPGEHVIAGPTSMASLATYDVIIKSPGIKPSPEIEAVRRLGKLTNSTQFFLEEAAAADTLVIGVTGSKGKSTTSSLIYHILKFDLIDNNPDPENKVLLIGNIGEPAIDHIVELDAHTICVLEMSSYQLMDVTVSPPIAVITSIFPEHLDYHGSFDAYKEAKAHIAKFQNPGDEKTFLGFTSFTRQPDRIYFHEDDDLAKNIASISLGEHNAVRESDALLDISATKLLGAHNQRNIALACKVTKDLGIPEESIHRALTTFTPLPHRLQNLGLHRGIVWIDDAISTTPDSTIAGIEALEGRVRTIILGGQDRGLDFTMFGKFIASSAIENVILFPGSGPRIKTAIEAAGSNVSFHNADSMEVAVRIAKAVTRSVGEKESPIVLLSTASPSYGMFKNFEEKGEMFKRCIVKD